ncbi:MAG: methylenetetrahydrofolate reductase, partial [Cyclobacteriaceae bacterium]|nr:methylenetetrahydrofolate reductase [Cyclobacteriaceae bacterium]
QGDAIKTEAKFIPEPDGFCYASELLEHVVNMNKGVYLDEELHEPSPTDFCIGVAGYPEKHYNAPNLKTDLKYLKNKVDKGADYIVTQMFFDNKKYFEFVDKCREAGINVPIIPGIKPLTTKSQLTILPQIFHIDLPEELADEADKCKDNAGVKQVGIEWAIKQSKELIAYGAPTIHFYSMGKSDPIYKIAKELF